MKRLIKSLTTALALVYAASSCSFLVLETDGGTTAEPISEEFILTCKKKLFPSDGGTIPVTILCEQVFEHKFAEDWATISNVKMVDDLGFTFDIKASSNPGVEVRNNTLTITIGSNTQTLEFSQEGQNPMILIEAPGVYGLESRNYTYDDPGVQLSRVKYPDGTSSVTFLYPSTLSVCRISNIPSNLRQNLNLELEVREFSGGEYGPVQGLVGKVLKAEDGKFWIACTGDIAIVF